MGSIPGPTRTLWALVGAVILAAVLSSSARAQPVAWSDPVPIDDHPPFSNANGLSDVSCPTESLCVAVSRWGQLLVSTDPAGGPRAWRAVRLNGSLEGLRLDSVSCPSEHFCLATGDGRVIWSSRPTARSSSWKPIVGLGFGAPTSAVSCASRSLCAVVAGGVILASTDPTAGKSSWQRMRGFADGRGLEDVSCPSRSFCAAVGGDNHVYTSTHPTGGVSAWKPQWVLRGSAIDCSSESFCVVPTSFGPSGPGFYVSTDPTAGARAWRFTAAPGTPPIESVSCVRRILCAAVDYDGNVITSTNPAAAAPRWRVARVARSNHLNGVSCPSASLCVAVDDEGNVAASTDPTGGTGAWPATKVVGWNVPVDLDCASESTCVAVDDAKNVIATTHAAAGSDAWTSTHLRLPSHLTGVSCPSLSLCVAVDGSGDVATSANPTAAHPRWHVARVDGVAHHAVSCVSASLCVAVGDREVIVSRNPTGGASAWRVRRLPAALNDISCPSRSLCVAVGADGTAATTTRPAGPAASWSVKVVSPVSELSSVSCGSPSLCVSLGFLYSDKYGNSLPYIAASSRPRGGLAAWTTHQDVRLIPESGDVSCATGSFCLAVSDFGAALVSYLPTGGYGAWLPADLPTHISRLPLPTYISALPAASCPSPARCVTVGTGYATKSAVATVGTPTPAP